MLSQHSRITAACNGRPRSARVLAPARTSAPVLRVRTQVAETTTAVPATTLFTELDEACTAYKKAPPSLVSMGMLGGHSCVVGVVQ